MKLGLHVNYWTDAARQTVRRSPPRILKVLSSAVDADEIRRWRDARPDGILVYRQHFADDRLDNWQDRVGALLHDVEPIRQWVSVAETPWNECYQTGDDLKRYAEATWFATAQIQKAGLKVAVGHFSVGWPQLADWPLFYPGLEYANYLSLHEYSAPTLMEQATWRVLRYRRAWEAIAPEYRKPIILTEFGIDWGVVDGVLEGWRARGGKPASQYVEELRWAATEMARDDYLVGATIYCAGTNDPQWESFNVAGDAEVERLLQETIPGKEDQSTVTEFDRWAADVFKRAGVPYNPNAALVRYWLDSARRGQYLGRPEGPEHPSEQGVPMQEFSSCVLFYRDNQVAEGLPF